MSKTIVGLPEMSSDPYTAHRPLWPPVDLRSPLTALLTIDMQYGCAHDDYGHVARAKNSGKPEDGRYYSERVRNITVPAIQRLFAAFREAKLSLFHTHVESLTEDGHDRSTLHKKLGFNFKPGSREAKYLEETSPRAGEIVLPKTTASPFHSTTLEYVLRNCGIENLVVCGVLTTGCVNGAVRDAAELGFNVVLVEDACAAHVEDMHLAAVRELRGVYAEVCSSDEVVDRIRGRSS